MGAAERWLTEAAVTIPPISAADNATARPILAVRIVTGTFLDRRRLVWRGHVHR